MIKELVYLFFAIWLLSYSHSTFSNEKGNYRVVSEGLKKGLVDEKGEILIPIQYDDLGWSDGSYDIFNNILGFKKGELWGLISIKNKKLTAANYTHLISNGEDIILAARKGKFSNRNFFGTMDFKGNNKIPYQYNRLEQIKNRFLGTYRKGVEFYQGVIDQENNIILPFIYKSVQYLGNNLFSVTNIEGKVAIYDFNGHPITGFQYDSISIDESSNYYQTYHEGFKGLTNVSGKEILKPGYKDIRIEESQITVLKFNNWKILNPDNDLKLELNFDHLADVPGDNLFKATIENQQWLINYSGNRVSPVFNSISDFQGSFAICRTKQGFGLLKADGNKVIDSYYDSLYYQDGFIYTLTKTEILDKWSIYDSLGVRKTNRIYQSVRPITNYLFPVKSRGKWGMMNREGKEVIQCVYDEIGDFTEEHLPVKFHGEFGIINKYGDWIVLPSKGELTLLGKNKYLRKTPYKTFLISIDGELIYFTENILVPRSNFLMEIRGDSLLWNVSLRGTIMDEITYNASLESAGILIAKKNNRFGALDENGNVIIPFNNDYQEIRLPSENFFPIKKDGKWGFIDFNNKLRIANRYDQVLPFNEGLATVKINGKWGFINKREEIIVQPVYETAENFSSGIAIVSLNSKFGIINKNGNTVQKIHYDQLIRNKSGKITSYLMNKTGIMGRKGNHLIFPKFDLLDDTHNGYYIVSKASKYGVLKANGVSTIPLSFDLIEYDAKSNNYMALTKSGWEEINP